MSIMKMCLAAMVLQSLLLMFIYSNSMRLGEANVNSGFNFRSLCLYGLFPALQFLAFSHVVLWRSSHIWAIAIHGKKIFINGLGFRSCVGWQDIQNWLNENGSSSKEVFILDAILVSVFQRNRINEKW